jgi:tetratricopeptide (TPR) repeat protein
MNSFGAEAARLTGVITDAITKKPLPTATVTARATEGRTFKQEFKTKKDGSYAIFLITGTIPYEFTFAAPGYQPVVETQKLKIGEANTRDIALTHTAAVAATVPAAEIKMDPSTAAYNEGAALANDKKDVEAIAKFEEAVAAKPDLIAGWMALAKVYARTKQYPKAIAAANKALEFDSEDPDMNAILYEAYTATGDKVKAAEAKKKMPANAPALFNDAARAINAQKDKDAEPLLKQAIAIDANFAPAYYELGMLYVRAGKNADAREHLQKYLELDPSGKDASTAKEMLNYVK